MAAHIEDFKDEENQDRTRSPRLLDRALFKPMINQVTEFALTKMTAEWSTLRELYYNAELGEGAVKDAAAERVAILEANAVAGLLDGYPLKCEAPTRYEVPVLAS